MVLVHDFLSRVVDLRRRSVEGSEDLRLRCLTSTKCHSFHNEASTRAILPPYPIGHSPRPPHPTTSPTRRSSVLLLEKILPLPRRSRRHRHGGPPRPRNTQSQRSSRGPPNPQSRIHIIQNGTCTKELPAQVHRKRNPSEVG